MPDAPLPSGTVTFLLTDVEGSTGIWESEPDRARIAFARHDSLVAEHISAFGGARPRDQGEGDSAMVVFSRASDALGCSIALQRALHDEPWPAGATIRVRMALHTGEAELAGGNYKGSAVHRCARLRGLAHGGQILLSEATAQVVRDHLPRDVTLRDMGTHELRGLHHPERAYQVCPRDLPSEFPPLKSASGRPHDLLGGAAVPLPSALVTPADDAFVGRVDELAALHAAWTEAATHHRLVLVGGEPGIGKSNLAARFASEVHALDATVMFGRCDEEALRPYQPIAEALSSYLRVYGDDELQHRLGNVAGDLARLVPELADRGSAPVQELAETESDRYRSFEAVATFLSALGVTARVLLVIDDLQWADTATLLLLRHLARHPDLARLTMLGTYRAEEAVSPTPFASTLVDLDRERLMTQVELSGLATPDVMTLVGRSSPQSIDLARVLRDETDGNPFFIREVLRDVAERGAQLDVEGISAPTRVRGVIAQRLARLRPEVKRVLDAAAVTGREFAIEVLDEMSALDEDDLLDALDAAVHAGVVRELTAEIGRYAFAHALVRQTLYEGLTLTRRARLHHRVAEAIEARYAAALDAHLAALAYHCALAGGEGDTQKALEYAWRAGDQSTRLLAFEDAGAQYEMARRALDALVPVDEARRYDLMCAIGQTAWRTNEVARARASFLEAADHARARADPVRFAGAVLGYGGAGQRPWWTEHGLVDEPLVALLEEALAGLDAEDTPIRVLVLGALAQQIFFTDQADRRRRLADEAVAAARRLGDPVTLVQALVYWHGAVWGIAQPRERRAVADEAAELARSLENDEMNMHAVMFRIVDEVELGDFAAAYADCAALAALARERHLPFYLWPAAMFESMRALFEGRFDEAEAMITDTFRIGILAHPSALRFMGAQLALLRRDQGRVDEFRSIVNSAFDQASDILVWRVACVLADLECGDEAGARAAFRAIAERRFADVPEDFFATLTLAMLADLCAALGDADRAALLYESLLPLRGQFVVLAIGVVCMGAASHYLGLLALTRGAWSDADELLGEAIDAHERAGALPMLTRSRLAHLRLLRARDEPADRERAGPLRARIIEEAERIGLRGVLDEARSLDA